MFFAAQEDEKLKSQQDKTAQKNESKQNKVHFFIDVLFCIFLDGAVHKGGKRNIQPSNIQQSERNIMD